MKTASVLVLATLAALTLYAQNFSIGAEAGIISSINTDYKMTDLENRRNTFYTGLNLTYNHTDRLSFTTGIHYLRQGYRHETCYIFEEGVKNQLVGKIDYLMIPLSANIHLLRSRKLIATLGLYGAYNVKAVQDYPESIGGCEIYYIEDLTDFTKNFSIGGMAGLGYKVFENNKLQLIPMIKYYQGLSNAFSNPYPDINMDITRRYSSLLMTLTFNYKL